VIGTASAQHNAYLKSIAVDEVIDYTKVAFEKQVSNVDAVIDTVGGDNATRAMTTLRRGGWFISTGNHDLDAECAKAGVKCAPYSSAADADRRFYEQLTSLVSAGKLKINVDEKYPLADAMKAQAYSKAGHAEGKIILIVDAAQAEKK